MDACHGLRVLEVSKGHTATALCGEIFAGFGATVVKLEPAGGDALRLAAPLSPDGVSHAFHLLNARKQSICLPADPESCRQRWHELAGWADIMLVDQSATALLPTDFDPSAFSTAWPGKVLCTISLFGHDSSKKSWQGGELIAEAISGFLDCTGYPERPPVCCGVPYAMHVSALFGFSGILAALWERDRSREGQWLDLSAVDCLICLLGNFIPSLFLSGRSPRRVGNRHVIAAPWNLYPSRDGYVVICTGTGGVGWWAAFCEVIERPDLAHDDRYDIESKRVARVEEVDRIVSEWSSRLSTAEIIARMTTGGIPASDVKSVADVLTDPHYIEKRGMVARALLDGGASLPLSEFPIKLGPSAPQPRPAPRLDAHDISLSAIPETAHKTEPGMGPASPLTPRSSPRGTMSRPLDGVRILEFGSRTSVPLAGRLLSDLGADVVKIEPPHGEGLRSAGQPIGGTSYIFHINNAGKRSFVVDPKSARGRELILELAAKTDIWLENLAPGVVERMGFGYARLNEINPRVIYCSVSGFGIKSNYGDKKAFDSVVQAASGMMFLTGYPDHLPVKVGISAADISAAVALVSSVMGALRLRQTTGAGTHVDVAMADVGMWMTQSAWPEYYYGTGQPERQGNRSKTACPHNLFATTDGYLAIAVETDAQWERLTRMVNDDSLTGDSTFSTHAGRAKNVARIEEALCRWTASHNSEILAARLQAAGVPAAPVRNLAAMVKDEDVGRRGLILNVEHPLAGRMRILGNPIKLSRTPALVAACAPVLNQHTPDVLAEWLGYSPQTIEQLCSSGVVSRSRQEPQTQAS